VQLVTEPEVARDILRSMGLPDQPPPVPRARSPAFDPDPSPADWDWGAAEVVPRTPRAVARPAGRTGRCALG
jgi:hypothetical protein